MEEFREDKLDRPRTADDQDCFSKSIVVRSLEKKSAEGMRAPHIFKTDNEAEFIIKDTALERRKKKCKMFYC